jgi:hypothetical protein
MMTTILKDNVVHCLNKISLPLDNIAQVVGYEIQGSPNVIDCFLDL